MRGGFGDEMDGCWAALLLSFGVLGFRNCFPTCVAARTCRLATLELALALVGSLAHMDGGGLTLGRQGGD